MIGRRQTGAMGLLLRWGEGCEATATGAEEMTPWQLNCGSIVSHGAVMDFIC